MRTDLHELEKVHSAPNTHNKGCNHGIKSPLRVAVIKNQCVHCGNTFADRPTSRNHVVNSWTRGTCRTDRSHMTWSLEEVTQPIRARMCASANVLRACLLDALALPSSDDQTESTCPASLTAKHAEEQQHRRQLRRNACRTKRDGGASGSTTVVAKPKADIKVEQKSLKKIMLKAILKTHQTMRDLSSTVWDTLLIKASSPKADSMQKQTRTYAVKVRQEEREHTRGPPFVWACLGLIKSLQQRCNTVGTRTAQGLSTCWARLEPLLPNKNLRRGSILQAGQNVQSGHQENHTEHSVARETIARSRSTRSNPGRAQVRRSTAHGHGTRATSVLGRSDDDVKIMVKAFLAESGVQANIVAQRHAERAHTAHGNRSRKTTEVRGERRPLKRLWRTVLHVSSNKLMGPSHSLRDRLAFVLLLFLG